jgi:hypothetical protein
MWNSLVVSPIMARSGDGGPLRVEPMKAASEPSPPPPGREAQSAEAVGNKLEAPKVNGFVEGEATAL